MAQRRNGSMAKTALITGGARGIGRVTAMRLMMDGYSVAFTYTTSKDAAREFVASDPERILSCEADVRDRATAKNVVDEVLKRFGSIDALVNNAGIRKDALTFHMSDEQ